MWEMNFSLFVISVFFHFAFDYVFLIEISLMILNLLFLFKVKNAFEVQRLVTFYDQTDRVSGSQFDHFVPEITGPITGELSVDKSSRPSTSIPNRSLVRSSSVRTEIEQCKRILNQLKRDVSQLPLLPIARFTPSMKDLDTLDLNPKVLQAAPLSYVRSRSQVSMCKFVPNLNKLTILWWKVHVMHKCS